MQRVKSWMVGGTPSGRGRQLPRKEGRWEGGSKVGWVKKGGNKSRGVGRERGREGGREGARGWLGREGTRGEGGRKGGREQGEGGSDNARQAESVS